MKTIEDLRNLIPTIVKDFSRKDHELSNDNDDYETNYYYYEEDGWFIEVEYRCYAEWSCIPGGYMTPTEYNLESAWGEVVEIYAYHDDGDDDIEFIGDDTAELREALNKALETQLNQLR